MYADYIRERTYDSIIESESGFATYRFLDDGSCYIIDIYVIPEARKTNKASELANNIAEIAKNNGCKVLVGTVCPSAKNSDTSIKVLQGYGMTLKSSTNDLIIFKKDL